MDDQLNVAKPPEEMDTGVAFSVTSGTGAGSAGGAGSCVATIGGAVVPVPVHAINVAMAINSRPNVRATRKGARLAGARNKCQDSGRWSVVDT